MNQRTTIGPRGWAIITLAGGAALASPFLRPSQLKTHEDFSASGTPALATPHWVGTAGEPTVELASVAPSGVSALPNASYGGPSGGRLSSGSGDLPTLHDPLGQTPTTVELPPWVAKASPLDALITASSAGSDVATSGQPDGSFLEPLKPWQNEQSNSTQRAVDLDQSALSSNRYSPWQASEAIAASQDATSSTETNWSIAPAEDVRALVQENTPATLTKPGGLVGATLQRTTSSPAASQEQVNIPKFVFQPGMKPQ